VPFSAEQGVDQARLADVRPPEHGELDRVVLFDLLTLRAWQRVENVFEHVGHASAVARRDEIGFGKAAFDQRLSFERDLWIIHLVGHKKDFLVLEGLLENLCDVEVEIGQPGAGVHYEDHRIGILDGAHGLFEHRLAERVVFGCVAAGVHEQKLLALPLAGADVAVPGHARRGIDDGAFLPENAVKKGRFADVGPTYQGDQWFHL